MQDCTSVLWQNIGKLPQSVYILIVRWDKKIFFFYFSIYLTTYHCRDSRNVWSNLFPKHSMFLKINKSNRYFICNSDQKVLLRRAGSKFQVMVYEVPNLDLNIELRARSWIDVCWPLGTGFWLTGSADGETPELLFWWQSGACTTVLTTVNNKCLKGKYMKSVLPTYGINFLPHRKSV